MVDGKPSGGAARKPAAVQAVPSGEKTNTGLIRKPAAPAGAAPARSGPKPTVAMLREVKLLQPFSDPELAQLIQGGTVSSFEAHSNIIIEGEMSWGLYLLLGGMVGIFKTNKLTGDTYDVGQLLDGSFFGEMSLIDNNPRSATVKALTDCQLFFISKDAFDRFLASSPQTKLRFYESCIKNLVTRLRELDDNYIVSQYQLWRTALSKESA